MERKNPNWLLLVALAGLSASVAVASPVVSQQSFSRQGTRLPSPQGPSGLSLAQGTRLPSPQGPGQRRS